MIIPGGEIGSVVEAIRRAEHPLPEVMETEEMKLVPARDRSKLVGLLRRLAYLRGLANRRVLQRLRSEKR